MTEAVMMRAGGLGGENNPVARLVLDRFEELKAERDARAPELEAVAKLYRPQRQGFRTTTGKRDDYNLHQLFNSTTLQSSTAFAAAVYQAINNTANDWFQATTFDQDLANWGPVKHWLARTSRRMLLSFSAGLSNFASSSVPWCADTAILGTGAMVSDEGRGRKRLVDSCLSPADFVFGVDADGEADEMMVERWLTPKQAADFYGIDALPSVLRSRAIAGQNGERTRFIQAWTLNSDWNPTAFGAAGKPWLSTHVSEDGKAVVGQSGTYEQAFAIPRFDVDGSNPWGHGMGYLNLASGRKLQAQERDNLTAGAFAAKPVMGTTGKRAIPEGYEMAPGAYMHGAISHTGQKLAQPLFTFNGLPITAEMAKQTREEVQSGWHAQLLTFVGRTGLGHMEVIEIMEERLRAMAPFLGRMQTEGHAVILERRFGIMLRAGQFDPIPKELAGQPLDIRFTSVAAQAAKAQEGLSTARLFQDVAALASVQPSPEAQAEVWDSFDHDAYVERMAEARGAALDVLRTPEQIAARREQRAQAAKAQQAMAMAAQGAAAAKDGAAAAQMMQAGAGQ